MKKKKFLFLTGSYDGTGKEAAILTILLKKELEQKYDVSIISDNGECAHELNQRGCKNLYLYNVIKNIKVDNILIELEKLEEKYSFSAEKILFGDVDYSSWPRIKAFEHMVKFFYFWESLLCNERFDFFFGGGVRYSGLIPNLIIKKMNKTLYISLTSSIFFNTFCLTSDNYGRFTLLDYYYKKGLFSVTEQQEESVIKLIKKWQNEIYSLSLQNNYMPKIDSNKLKFFINRLANSHFEKDTPYINPLRGTKKYILKIIKKWRLKFIFYQFPRNENYFYYPLQVHDDSNRVVWNNHIESQLSIIRLISRALPANCFLYVKEHPASIGNYNLGLLKQIKQVPKVKLLSPFISGKEVIIKSKGVITLSGTSGVEALVLRKPVIVIGRAYYDFNDLVDSIQDFKDFDTILKKIYFTPTLPPWENVLNLLLAYRKTCYPGTFAMAQYYYYNDVDNSSVLTKENAEKIANGIFDYINESKK